MLGTGVGLSIISPWYGAGASAATVGVSAVVWLVVVQWISSGLGGFLAGRLRTKWVRVHAHEVSPADKAYVAQMVAARTGLSQPEAQQRVDTVVNQLNDAEQKVRQTADVARKRAAQLSIATALSMLIGAFIASAAAAWWKDPGRILTPVSSDRKLPASSRCHVGGSDGKSWACDYRSCRRWDGLITIAALRSEAGTWITRR